MNTIGANFVRLIDDAAIFPPGNLPLDEAVAAHRGHRHAEYADLVGGFVVSDVLLPELIKTVGESEPLAINVVVTGGAGGIEPAVRWATGCPALRLEALELKLRDEADLPHNAQRFITAIDALRDEAPEVTVYVEMPALQGPPTHGWLSALDEIAMVDYRLKFRTGGDDATRFPAPAELASAIDAALDRELAFKCTAGLHHAVRHRDPRTGITHHGFLNVLLATQAALAGGDVVAALEETDPATVAEAARADLTSARRWFTSVGSCSVQEPLDDLAELGLARKEPR